MKEHTLVFSGTQFIGLAVSLVAGGALLFGVGLFVGIAITEAPAKASDTALPVTVATIDNPTPPEDAAAWPFGVAAPAGAPPVAADTTAAKSAPTTAQPDHRRAGPDASDGSDAAVSAPAPRPAASATSAFRAVAYVAPSSQASDIQDATPYVIQVGAFRSERLAASLAARLTAAGYKPTIIDRDDDNGRTLHVVRVARVVGRDRATRVAEAIGDAEQVVASVIVDRGH